MRCNLGDMDRARIELNRAEQRQTNAVEQLAVKVRALGEDAPEEEESRKTQGEQVDRAFADVWKPDSPVGRRLAAVEALGEYRDLRNPFTDWLHGVFRLATGEANRASNLFRMRPFSMAGTTSMSWPICCRRKQRPEALRGA